ncbi:polyamine-transporting ATPase [Mesorhizobium sp. L-8-10]|nr:polyamine-transporting ATPase [Mesorhizobium sp. L-8-10]
MAAGNQPAGVRLDNVTKNFGAITAVRLQELEIRPGEFLTLLGPSGCGKTTLLKIIAGFERPDTGTLSVDGRDITDLAPEKRNFGMVFQGYALFPHLTVAENIGFALRRRGVARQERDRKIADALALVRMTEFGDRMPRMLSGGQQQRVALARAIVFSPDLVLLDEPLSALDAGLREALQVELRALHHETGMTFICVTHDQQEALSLSDRIAVLNGGKVLQVATPESLYSRPVSEFVARFMGARNIIRIRVEAVRDGLVKGKIGGLCIVHALDSDEHTEVGRDITLAFRPNALSLGTAADHNSVPGRVVARNYHGSDILFTVATELGELSVTQSVRTPGATATEGDNVAVSWADTAGVTVTPDS